MKAINRPDGKEGLIRRELGVRALKLRLDGLLFPAITNALGPWYFEKVGYELRKPVVRRAVRALLQQMNKKDMESMSELRQLHFSRLERMFTELVEIGQEVNKSGKKNPGKVIDRMLRVLSRQSSLFGLDAPVIKIENTNQMSLADFMKAACDNE